MESEIDGSTKTLFWYYLLELDTVLCICASQNSFGSTEVKRNRLVMALHVLLLRAAIGKRNEAPGSLN